MSFNSILFLGCLPIVLVAYWLLPHRFRWIMLLAVSYLFYMSWNPWLIFLIFFTTIVSYIFALIMEKHENKRLKKLCLIATLISCLGVLFFFKYFTFTVNLVISIINLGPQKIPEFAFSLLLPVGISFYTFQTLSYVIDVYRGKISAEKHFGYYALYVSFFPQLVAGPIERPENLIPQLKEEIKFKSDDLILGLRIAIIGYFKKIVIADGVAGFVNSVYNNVSDANGLTVVLATVLFAIQIYCDFSGYSDIAIGVARMMGIKLCKNFDRPYSATNIKDFWRRWHMSLTSWFTDYVYIPLGGNRCKLWRWAINIMIVFLLSGLWHGASLTFVVWGGIHGIYQIFGKLKNLLVKKFAISKKLEHNANNEWIALAKRLITFALVCFAWIFFRGNSLSDCGILIAKVFSDWSNSSLALEKMGFDVFSAIQIVFMILLLSLSHYVSKDGLYLDGKSQALKLVQNAMYIYMVFAVAISWISLVTSGGESAFIYFQF